MVHPCFARMGLEFHGGPCLNPHGPGISVRSLQVSSGAYVDRWRVPFAYDPRDGFQRTSTALRPGRLLGTWHWSIDRQPSSYCGSYDREGDARWANHRWRDALAILRPARLR